MAKPAPAATDQTLWEHRWQSLPKACREALLYHLFLPYHDHLVESAGTPTSRWKRDTLQHLLDAGWVKLREKQSARSQEELLPVAGAVPFLRRVQRLTRSHLLRDREGDEHVNYWAWDGDLLERQGTVYKVLKAAGITARPAMHELFQDYVPLRQWPDWVLGHLHLPLATQLFQAIEARPRPVPLGDVPGLVPQANPQEVRVALRDLVGLMALGEDLEDNTLDLVVGLLPAVRKARKQQRKAPASGLSPSPDPALWLPPSGYLLDDLRAVLLDLSSQPARLKQDDSVYTREVPRFEQRLAELPEGLLAEGLGTTERRVYEALGWARLGKLAEARKQKGEHWLQLSGAGRKWLGQSLADQYRAVYNLLRSRPPDHSFLAYTWRQHDAFFLGTSATAVRGKSNDYSRKLTDDDRAGLRDGFLRAFRLVPDDGFVTLDSFLDHAVASANPLALDRDPRKFTVYSGDRRLPPVADLYQDAGRKALLSVIEQRLVPLGCLILGQNEAGERVIKRQGRLDAFFGEAVTDDRLAGGVAGPSRVIVQPDFSVLVIGLNTAAAADLSAFCDRVPGVATPGTIHMKLTRASVIRGALQTGLGGDAVVEMVGRHSNVPLPANVAHEVREWGGQVRQVTSASCTVLRCPDPATAECVRAVVGTTAVVIGDHFVAIAGEGLTAAVRRKLLAEGVNVQPGPLTGGPAVRKKTSRKSK